MLRSEYQQMLALIDVLKRRGFDASPGGDGSGWIRVMDQSQAHFLSTNEADALRLSGLQYSPEVITQARQPGDGIARYSFN